MRGSAAKRGYSLIILLGLFHLPVYAVNPVPGSYAGVFLGPTYTPNITFTINQIAPVQVIPSLPLSIQNLNGTQGTLQYSVLGGIGGNIGYRFCDRFRIEIEALYNNNPYTELTFGDYQIKSNSKSTTLHISGDTNLGAGLINFYFDALTPSRDNYGGVFPYVGLGVGYAYVQNSLQFKYNTPAYLAENPAPTQTNFETKFTRTYATYAGQAILGIGYFLDDFVWISADIRYFSTKQATIKKQSNVTLNYASFEQQAKLLSFMVSFNGAFDFG